MHRENIRISSNVLIEVHDAAGNLLREERIHNLVVDTGLNSIRDLLGGTGMEPTHIAVGTNGNPVLSTDTSSQTGEVFRKAITRRVAANKKITFQLFIDTTEANGNTLRDCRLSNNAAPFGGDLYARGTYTSIVKDSLTSVTITWDVNLEAK